jgi:hypothetical protein
MVNWLRSCIVALNFLKIQDIEYAYLQNIAMDALELMVLPLSEYCETCKNGSRNYSGGGAGGR